MRNIVTLIIVVALGAYGVSQYRKATRAAEAAAAEPPVEYLAPRPQPQPQQLAVERETAASAFRCDGRQHCSQMLSCDEARYFVQNCPNVKMDGDRDGNPCEDWCGH